MIKSYDGKQLPTIKFLAMPFIMLAIIVASFIKGMLLVKGDDMVAIYEYNQYFAIGMPVLVILSFLSIMFTVGKVGPGNGQNLLVALNLAVMIASAGIFILSISSWDKKPQAALNSINSKLRPIIDELFIQESIKPLEATRDPMAPYTIVDASMTIAVNGDYLFMKPQVEEATTEDSHQHYNNTDAQNLHLLQMVQSGQAPDSYKSIAVVVRQWVMTGRNIQLDVGSVPELRQQVVIYVVDITTWQVVTEIGPIYGSRAHRPFGGPGAGVIYLSELRGNEVKENTILKLLDKLTWE